MNRDQQVGSHGKNTLLLGGGGRKTAAIDLIKEKEST